MKRIVFALICALLFANETLAQGIVPVADTSDYRTATYGPPTKYASPTRSLTNPGTGTITDPWNLSQAESLAVCGDVVGILSVNGGTPVALPVPSIYQEPAFNPTATCTASNRLVYVARFPAVMLDPLTAATDSRRSEIRTNGTRESNDVQGTGRAAYGTYQRNYVTYDGLYLNMQHVGINGDQGLVTARASVGFVLRNFAFDGMTTDMDSNAILWRPENTQDAVLSNFWVRNFRNQPTGGGLNQPGFFSDQYGDQNYLIEYFDMENLDNGIFPKGTSGGIFNYGRIHHGMLRNIGMCMRFNDFHATQLTTVENNVCVSYRAGFTLGSETSPPRNVLFRNNTTVAGSTCSDCIGAVYIKQDSSANNVTIRDNLFEIPQGTGHGIDAGEASMPFPTTDYNGYFRGGAVMTWSYNGLGYSSLTDWRAATGQEAHSLVLSSDPFIDKAGGNYRVRAGHAALTASSSGGEIGAYAGAEPPPNCTFTLSPTSASVSASASTGTITVTASGSSCTWTATSQTPWITTTSSGTGSGLASYTVAANTGAARNGTLLVAGLSFAVAQAAASSTSPETQLEPVNCEWVVKSDPPDTTGGWSVQFKERLSNGSVVNVGSVDSTTPYRRKTGFLTPGPHTFFGTWTKSGVPTVTGLNVTQTCQ